MVTASIDNPNGVKIQLEGSAEELAIIIARVHNGVNINNGVHVSQENNSTFQKEEKIIETEDKVKKSSSKQKVISPPSDIKDKILMLKTEGFFDTPCKLNDVKKALEQKAFYYPNAVISTALIRRVKKGELRRIADGKQWVYIKN